MPTEQLEEEVRQAVRKQYASVATNGRSCGCAPACCAKTEESAVPPFFGDKVSQALGYSAEEIDAVPEGANLGLGCGNPQTLAALKAGEIVLDLGSGAGFDVFLAAKAVGPTGLVIGVDMTPEMISKARQNKASGGYANVEFRLGEIENLPVADNSVDVIISNCVINLSPNKPRVYREAWRVLKPEGRLAISDVVAMKPLPDNLLEDLDLYAGCVAGVSLLDEVKKLLSEAGFTDVRVEPKSQSKDFMVGTPRCGVRPEWFPDRGLEDYIVSAMIHAIKV